MLKLFIKAYINSILIYIFVILVHASALAYYYDSVPSAKLQGYCSLKATGRMLQHKSVEINRKFINYRKKSKVGSVEDDDTTEDEDT